MAPEKVVSRKQAATAFLLQISQGDCLPSIMTTDLDVDFRRPELVVSLSSDPFLAESAQASQNTILRRKDLASGKASPLGVQSVVSYTFTTSQGSPLAHISIIPFKDVRVRSKTRGKSKLGPNYLYSND